MDNHKTRRSNGAKHKYPEQHLKLVEMGFDVKSINSALEATNGDLESATVLLVEKAAAAVRGASKVINNIATSNEETSLPMKVVGKSSSKASKSEIREAHNRFMSIYKTTKCKDKGNHDKRMCFYWHTKSDRRRNPFDILYTCSECPNSTETAICENGDNCLKAHNMLERMFHPELFKISMCQRGPNGNHCERGNLCAFAHSDEDHRVPLSQTLAKANATSGSIQGAVHSTANLYLSANEHTAAGKVLGESKMLDDIQDRLVQLIKSQGVDGIISSELPKRYSDVYSERLELADENGEKFRIKDLLLSHPNIIVIMHKGVQPKYVYNESEAPVAKDKSLFKTSSATANAPAGQTDNATVVNTAAPLSYSAVTTISKAGRVAPLNYAAAVTESIINNSNNSSGTNSVAASTLSIASLIAVEKMPSTDSASNHFPKEVYNGWHSTTTTGIIDHNSISSMRDVPLPALIEPASPTILACGMRRRGPDPVTAIVLDDPPSPISIGKAAYNQSPSGLSASYSDVSSGKTNLIGEQSSIQQVQMLKTELDRKSMEYDLQSKHLQEVLLKLNDFESLQSTLYGQRESAIAEAYRARAELEDYKSKFDEKIQKSSEINSRDYTISHLNKERSMDLHQYYTSINQIEIALVEMQRKEALYINEIPLHDTINESSRARDELTKFVTLLKMQINAKIVNEAQTPTNNNHSLNLLSLSSSVGSTVSNGSESKHGYPSGVSSYRSFGSLAMPPVGTPVYLNASSLDLQQSKRTHLGFDELNRTLALSTEDDDAFRRMISGAAAHNSLGIGIHGGNNGRNALIVGGGAASLGRKVLKSEGCVCGLPGCHLEGTFICSACNRTGYCGSEHQREHWALHMSECVSVNH